MAAPQQQIRFASSPDGVRLAYAVSGRGEPTLIKAATWLSHLEFDWESPVWRHLLRELSARGHFVRYDERGCGLSDRDVADLGFASWVRDLETVADAIAAPSASPCSASRRARRWRSPTRSRHPERVSHLVLHGGYARGRLVRGEHAGDARGGRDDVPAWPSSAGARTIRRSASSSPASSSPAARPSSTAGSTRLERISTSPPTAARFMREFNAHRRHGAAARRCAARRWCCTAGATCACRSTKAG